MFGSSRLLPCCIIPLICVTVECDILILFVHSVFKLYFFVCCTPFCLLVLNACGLFLWHKACCCSELLFFVGRILLLFRTAFRSFLTCNLTLVSTLIRSFCFLFFFLNTFLTCANPCLLDIRNVDWSQCYAFFVQETGEGIDILKTSVLSRDLDDEKCWEEGN